LLQSGCPYLTSVGATQSYPETAAGLSSGGFSNYFDIPSYQASAVASYKTSLGSTYSGKFNTTGRGYPDVAAFGENVYIVYGGQTGAVAGTSCASPIFASTIGLINDRLIAVRRVFPFDRAHTYGVISGRQGASRLPQPVAVLDRRVRAQRHHVGLEPGLQHQWLPREGRLGPRHRPRHAQLRQAPHGGGSVNIFLSQRLWSSLCM
jgi:hypothetical protein